MKQLYTGSKIPFHGMNTRVGKKLENSMASK